MSDTERWLIGIAVTLGMSVLASAAGAVWYFGVLWARGYDERQNKEFTTIHGSVADIRDAVKSLVQRVEDKYVSRETFEIRMGHQDRDLRAVQDDLGSVQDQMAQGFEQLSRAIQGKVSKDRWPAAKKPDSDPPIVPPHPRMPSRPGRG